MTNENEGGGAMGISLYAVKPRFQVALRRVAARCVSGGVSADALTAAGLGAAAVAGVTIGVAGAHPGWWLALVPLLLFARLACNALDGMVARDAGTARPWGTVLNETGDRVADLLVCGGLVASGALPPFAALALLPALLFVSYLGVIGQAAGGARCYAGPLGKADRMALVSLYCLAAPWLPLAGAVCGWVLLAGLALTAVNRLRMIARDPALQPKLRRESSSSGASGQSTLRQSAR
jgi:CDP-diacylglycerol--glycerol-3-phosphate 3-phosphatidyltransferase